MTVAVLALALAAGAGLGAGCGSAGDGDGAASASRPASSAAARTAPPPATTSTTTTTRPRPAPDPRLAAQRASFRANCAACHTLRDADAHGTGAGGESNLDDIRPNVSSVRNYIVHGFGAMPSFRGRLSGREIDALARYVATVDGCGVRSATACDDG